MQLQIRLHLFYKVLLGPWWLMLSVLPEHCSCCEQRQCWSQYQTSGELLVADCCWTAQSIRRVSRQFYRLKLYLSNPATSTTLLKSRQTYSASPVKPIISTQKVTGLGRHAFPFINPCRLFTITFPCSEMVSREFNSTALRLASLQLLYLLLALLGARQVCHLFPSSHQESPNSHTPSKVTESSIIRLLASSLITHGMSHLLPWTRTCTYPVCTTGTRLHLPLPKQCFPLPLPSPLGTGTQQAWKQTLSMKARAKAAASAIPTSFVTRSLTH